MKKTAEIDIFLTLDMKNMTLLSIASFCPHLVLLLPKKGEKYAFLLKDGLTTCYLCHHISQP